MRIISGSFRGRRLKPPQTDATRPILDHQKEALFNILREQLPCFGVLDIFAGSGSLGLEAISRGAEQGTFVERGHKALAALRENVTTLGVGDRARILKRDAFRLDPTGIDHSYGLVFLDPPFPLVTEHPARVVDLAQRLGAGLDSESPDGGRVVLRVPVALDSLAWPDPPVVRQLDERVFGESRVLILGP